MTRKAFLIILGTAAGLAFACGLAYSLTLGKPTGRWAADESLEGATVQLWFTIERQGIFESQIACSGSSVLRSSDMRRRDAAHACRLLNENRRFFKTLLTASPPSCPGSRKAKRDWVKYRGKVWGEDADRYFYPGPCLRQMDNFYSAFTLSKLLAPADLKQIRTPSPEQLEESRRAREAGKDVRPSTDRLYPCPPGVKSTKIAPCRAKP